MSDRRIAYSNNPIMAGAWASAVQWALSEPQVMEAFRKDTGNRWSPAKSGLEKMIDDATGAPEAFADAFVDWFNANVWGEDPFAPNPASGKQQPAQNTAQPERISGANMLDDKGKS